MALKLTVGVSKKVGQPNYGSLGAQCQLEYDMDITLLVQDREQFQQRVRQAYQACSQAVDEELARDRRGLSVTQSPPAPPAAASAAAPEPAEPRGPGADGSSASQEPGPNGGAAGVGPPGGQGTHGGNGTHGGTRRTARA